MTVDIISQSVSSKEWDRAGIEPTAPGFVVELATDCAMGPGISQLVPTFVVC